MHHTPGCKYRPNGNAHSVFSLKPAAAVPCGPAVTSPPLTMTSTTLITISSSCLRTLPLRLLCLRACLRLMSYTQPLVADSLWIFSRFRSNIPLHLITSHFLTVPSSPHLEHGCYTRLKTDTMASLLGPRSWKGTHTLSLSLCVRGTRGYTVSTQDMLTSTAPVLPALSNNSLHPRHTRPAGPGTQCPTTQSWFAFHTAVSAHVPSHLGSSRSVFVHAGLFLAHRGHTWW